MLKRRRESTTGDGTVPLGVKKEITIGDVFGDKYILYSNGGVFSPDESKGWSDEGMERHNFYYEFIAEFQESEAGKEAMVKQRRCWSKSPLSPNKRCKSDDNNNNECNTVTTKIKVRCLKAVWT